MERPMVTFSTWKSWYLLFNVFIRYKLFLLVANALLWPSIGFCINAFFCIFFSFILALTLFELILLFSIDHQGIKLTLNYLSGVFVWCLSLYKSHRMVEGCLMERHKSVQAGDTLFEVSTVVSETSSCISSSLPHSRKDRAYLRNCESATQ